MKAEGTQGTVKEAAATEALRAEAEGWKEREGERRCRKCRKTEKDRKERKLKSEASEESELSAVSEVQ